MSIKEFFAGQEIFITGGSGFIGKALIEKILRSCPDFTKIFVLMRPKKGKTEIERLNEIFQTRLFERARFENPEGFKRIEAISGDCAEKGLGIHADDLRRMQNISIIYHSAASVRFDDPLADAILLNTRGTWELLKIAEALKKLQVFLHISTTYCNSDRMVIEEKVYKPFVNWGEAIKLAECMDHEILNTFALKYSNFKPNTYCFTKALAEQVVADYSNRVPVLILRPAMVTNCLDDPIPGWIDNFNGPIGLLTGCGLGIVRVLNSSGKCLHSVVPVDIVVRALIVATYKKGLQSTKSVKPDLVDVYNCAIDTISPLNTLELIRLGRIHIAKNPFERTLWAPDGSLQTCPVLYNLKFFMIQLLMSIFLDAVLRLKGRKPIVLKLQRRISCAMKATIAFINNQWEFKVETFFSLDKFVPSMEYDDFAFLEKASGIDWNAHLEDCIKGTKEFLLNESRESSPSAQRRCQIYKITNNLITIIFYFALVRYLYSFFKFLVFPA